MICIRCGECCRTMSPLGSETDPCPHLVMKDTVATCKIYPSMYEITISGEDKRPKQCQDHEFPARVCPIGMDFLKLTFDEIRSRGQLCRTVDGK